jgi:hypothetical protein
MAQTCILCRGDVGWRGSYGAEINNFVLHPVCLKCKERCTAHPEQIIDSHPRLFEKMLADRHSASSGGTAATRAPQAESSEREQILLKRYEDAFLVAKTTVGIGSMVKGTGVILAMMIMLGSFIFSVQLKDIYAIAVIGFGMFWSIAIGLLLYAIGTLIAAQGQMVQATLDSAVNSSPFLNDELRAKIMAI